jgi:hypothetical protein
MNNDDDTTQPAEDEAIRAVNGDETASDSTGETENVHTPMDPTKVATHHSKSAAAGQL